ncbi:MAG: hypothetical protein SVU88_01120 [Candidatus Nanohaloarchaea archaeon]|nr:hypothetical protein [Candidatus Nanohaloarchaea archaeon]
MSPGRSDGVLVLTHPYEFFANGRDAAAAVIRETVHATDEDVYGVKPGHGHRKLDEPIGGKEFYDRIVEDRDGYGRLARTDASDVAEYRFARIGGFDRNQCVGRTMESIRYVGGDAAVEPSITARSAAVEQFFRD